MLNNKKRIIDTTPPIKDKDQSFLDLPMFPKNVITNSFLSDKVSKKFPFVFQKSNDKNLTFMFSGKKYRDQYFFMLHKKDMIDLHDSYTKKVVILNKIFKAKKTFKSFLLKTVRGGLMTTSLGLISFVPKSLKSKSGFSKCFMVSLEPFAKIFFVIKISAGLFIEKVAMWIPFLKQKVDKDLGVY